MKSVFMLCDSRRVGGARRQMIRLSNALSESGWDISILTTTGLKSRKEKIANSMTRHSIPSISARYLSTASLALSTVAFFIKRRPAILHAHHLAFGIAGAIVKSIFGGRLIIKIGVELDTLPKGLRRLAFVLGIKAVKNITDRFVALNRHIASELVLLGVPEKKIARIPNGIDLKKFRPLKMEKLGESAVVVARIVPAKKTDVAVRAWKIVAEAHPKSKLTIFGGYESNAHGLIGTIKELGLHDNIEVILGRDVSAEDYCRHEIFLATTSSEGMSNSLLEAMACAMPIVATRIPAVEGVLESKKNCLLVEVGDEKQAAEAIMRLFGNKKFGEKLGQKARERAKTFDIRKIARIYSGLYSSITKTGRENA